MEILIVGGTGVISYAVVLEALKQGIAVTCINRGKSKDQKLPNNVKTIIADYHNEQLMKNALKGKQYDAVIDFLCYKVSDIEYSVNLFRDICSQYIFISSCAVYNKGKGNYVCDEKTQLINPVWDYSINKVACEKKLIESAAKCNLQYTIVRPAVTYGNTRIPYGIMPPYGYHGTIIQRILNGKPIILWDNGETISTITRVEDFAIGMIGLLGNPGAFNQAFNIVGDERVPWKEIIEELGSILRRKPVYVNITKEQLAKEIPDRKGEILGGRGINLLVSNEKLKSVVPVFKTNIPLRQGLEMTVRYYMDNNYLSGIDYDFDGNMDRIAAKYDESYHPVFIDYLKNATDKDRLKYRHALMRNVTLERLKLYTRRRLNLLKKTIRMFVGR